MWVGISAVGVFETRDGGATWQTRNRGVRADFNPENRYPEFGQCVHKLVLAADGGERLYQQNHCGVYRSTDGGEAWEEITAGLPSQFGFVMTAHPRDPMTVWTIPLTEPEDGRLMPDGAAAVWRTNDGGGDLDPLRRGPAAARTPTSACCARRWRSTGSTRSACTSARARASCTARPTRA